METIAARATPYGSGGVGIVRISGQDAKNILHRLFKPANPSFKDFQPWRLHYGKIVDSGGELLDEVLAVFMPGPGSFTGEDVAEIHCHGGMAIVESVLESAIAAGARLAERGEFSRRAFINGRLDLSQAEAIAEMIAAPTRKGVEAGFKRLAGGISKEAEILTSIVDQARQLATLGLDFPEDEIDAFKEDSFSNLVSEVHLRILRLLAGVKRSELLEQGARVVIAGAVNAGKSSLFNALCGQDRALVADIPGTTRDFLEAVLDLDGMPVRIIDTAGLRFGSLGADYIESLGISRTWEQLKQADALILVVDGADWEKLKDLEKTSRLDEILSAADGIPVLVAINKSDIAPKASLPAGCDLPSCKISALTGENISSILESLKDLLRTEAEDDCGGIAPNHRQAIALAEASRELALLLEEWQGGVTLDCAMTRLDAVRASVAGILGLGTPAEILDDIFGKFCIGK